ncbi:UDP-glucuronosyl/UDP-glucosyltransferase [Parasponia andersonii]|uniref:Glycosyltransferase n=1 Tax=Parasponia andersonii TaxID=3476 RepID=A0A2P5D1W5_PARAD|nr:UDP-glucuronosyl/UDP-glucosyltransferase [Parasponia andersonii]
MKQLTELVFIPHTARGHMASMLEFAKLLLARDDRLCITVLIMKFPLEPNLAAYADSVAASFDSERINFIDITQNITFTETNFMICLDLFIENQKQFVKTAVSELVTRSKGSDSPRTLAGFVVNTAYSTMIDVANEFGVPAYGFWPGTAGWLGLNLHLQALQDEKYNKDVTELENHVKRGAAEVVGPSFVNPVPASVVPSVVFDKAASNIFTNGARRLRMTKGIVVNTFMELESHAIRSVFPCVESPTVYPVGPILNLTGDGGHAFSSSSSYSTTTDDQNDDNLIIKWLDDQPSLSVIFLCFGSGGSLGGDQLKEIGSALERTGFRFLWCLRHSSPNGDYDPKQVLPEGFLDRTAKVGKVIRWAPQVKVLSHTAVGGFVSHCGWNSLLESLWFGVPVATWPLFADQQLNAFEMVRELELAVEIKMDYKLSWGKESVLVSAKEIEIGIRRVMEGDSDIRRRVKEMSEKGRKALMEGGSSHSSLGRFINNVFDNLP